MPNRLSDEALNELMAKGWQGGLPETPCGFGSTSHETRNVRRWLPDIVKRYDIRSVNDAGAGDMVWIRKIGWKVDYLPFDLVPRHPDVVKLDITRDAMPGCDAILCRHVLNHLDADRVGKALDLFRESARYLIATQFNEVDGEHEAFTRLDLRRWLGDPLESIADGGARHCRLAIWKL